MSRKWLTLLAMVGTMSCTPAQPVRPGPVLSYGCWLAGSERGETQECWWDVCVSDEGGTWWVQSWDGWWTTCADVQNGLMCDPEVEIAAARPCP